MSPSLRDLNGRDPYEILGVAVDSSTQQIVEAHRRLIRQVHPDRPSGDAEATRLVNLARAVLTDPSARAEYDRQAAAGLAAEEVVDPPTASAWDAEDVTVGAAEPTGSAWESVPPEPPPWPPPPGRPSAFGPPPPWPPPPGPPPPFQHWPPPPPARSGGLSLGIAALICSLVCCTPLGLVLGLVALSRRPAPGSTDRTCAIAAVAVSGVLLLCGVGYLLLFLIAGLGSAAGG